jgi:hypothetical protein
VRTSLVRFSLADDMRELQKAKQTERALMLAAGGTPVDVVLKSLEEDCRKAATEGLSSTRAVFLDFVGSADAIQLSLKQRGFVVKDIEIYRGALFVTLSW